MAINQRDVFLLPYPLKDNRNVKPHYFIVLSSAEANANECTFLAVMITASDTYRDELSFDLTDDMFEKPLEKSDSHVRCHLITVNLNKDIIGNPLLPKNRMKKAYFTQLMRHIGEMVFEYDFFPL